MQSPYRFQYGTVGYGSLQFPRTFLRRIKVTQLRPGIDLGQRYFPSFCCARLRFSLHTFAGKRPPSLQKQIRRFSHIPLQKRIKTSNATAS